MIDYSNLTEEEQIAIVEQDGLLVRFIKNPTEDVKLAALKNKGFAIIFLDKVTQTDQLVALENYWYKDTYDFIKEQYYQTDWLNKEINRLKLEKGVMND